MKFVSNGVSQTAGVVVPRQLLEVETLCMLFHDNAALCNEVTERVVQHVVRCIETHGRHMQYIKFLQTIVKSENTYIRKCQDMVMTEVSHDTHTQVTQVSW